jgi:hypothetical protein
MQPLRRNTPNYKRGKKNRAEEGCETKGQENVTLSEVQKHAVAGDRDRGLNRLES